MTKKFQLGRGLGSLISSNTHREEQVSSKDRIIYLSPEEIQLNPYQPRKNFAHQDLEDLINSIKEHGIIQPLIVSQTKEGKYQLIAGERRLRAAKFLDLPKVPVILRKASEIEKLELSLVENIQRKDLNPIEKARAYQKLIEEFGYTQEKLAKKIGKSRPSVTNTLRLLSLPEEIKDALAKGRISEAHARVILGFDNPVEQLNIFRKIILRGLTVHEVEERAKKRRKKQKEKLTKKSISLLDLEERLEKSLGTKAEIKKRGGKGKIIIYFYSSEDLRNLINKICR